MSTATTGIRLRRREPLTNATLLMLISIVIFILMYGAAVLFMGEKGFDKPQMLLDLLNGNAYLIILGCSLTVVMIGGGINISVGGVVGLTAMACALFLRDNGIKSDVLSINATLLLALGIGLAFGLLQGYLISYLEIQPFIITLAGMVLARGLTTVLSTAPVAIKHEDFKALVATKIEIPWLGYMKTVRGQEKLIPATLELGVVIALLTVAVIFLMMRKTKLGRGIYALGGNEQSAVMLGINVKRTRFRSYVISGLAGFVYLMHTPSANTTSVAMRSEMDAIAASIIGGTLLTGGVGNVIGTFFGVMILTTIRKIIGLSSLNDSWWQEMASGAMLGLFIVLQSIVLSTRGKKVRLPLRRSGPQQENPSGLK